MSAAVLAFPKPRAKQHRLRKCPRVLPVGVVRIRSAPAAIRDPLASLSDSPQMALISAIVRAIHAERWAPSKSLGAHLTEQLMALACETQGAPSHETALNILAVSMALHDRVLDQLPEDTHAPRR